MNNNQNIFDMQNKIQNINMQNFGNNYNRQDVLLNPTKMTFEKNRTFKDDKILYYAIATTDFKIKAKKEQIPAILHDIIFSKDVYCLVGISRKFFHFQYYSIDGELIYSNMFSRSMIQSINSSYLFNTTLIQVKFNKKENIDFYFPDNLDEISTTFTTFGEKDQTLIMKHIRDGIAKKDLLM